ncbi:MAG: bifunctional hydroxymethylpyrimidine kinase/phosphomethylpyrimidine kinase [Arthrobacter sp.]|uniref:bifunctional hydroxymethylpyrimidine kinase/phosphomethylpyrimidine kinase n=1 Tax=Arthrobacter sp. TaxID=1667 RepID=UPI00347A0F08
MSAVPNILSIAGSDPSGGAGIQADLKSIAACGGYGMAAITALTAQNTRGVAGVHIPPPDFLSAQLSAISEDVRVDAVKIGMLGNAGSISAVTDWLRTLPQTPVVLDPVMVATSGDRLLAADADAALRELLRVVDVVTPNLAELAVLAGEPAAPSWERALAQARAVASEYGVLVLAKGGHLADRRGGCPDALVDAHGVVLEVVGDWADTRNTHGTGCSLSSALATLYARTGTWPDALRLGKAWLGRALADADALGVGSGAGHGPVHHFAGLWAGERPPSPAALVDTWWDAIAGVREDIDSLAFVRGLKDGTLARADFEHYLRQDALYLRTFAQALSRASALAPDAGQQRFWASAAAGCLEEELQLHRTRLGSGPPPEPSATTAAYLNHLTASGRTYPVLVAAILPCFWLYQDAGSRLAAAHREGHPYADWLAAYSSVEFDRATREAVAVVQRVALRAGEDEIADMRRAFVESARHELLFFAQTDADGDPGGSGAAFGSSRLAGARAE